MSIREYLGDIRFPAKSKTEAIERYNRALDLRLSSDIELTLEDHQEILAEIQMMNDQLSWYRGYSDIKGEDDDKEDYMMFIRPGDLFDNDKTKLIRLAQREKKAEVKNDLGRYYRYNRKMMNGKIKKTMELMMLYKFFSETFAKYGMQASLCTRTKDSEGNESFLYVSSDVLDKLLFIIKTYLNEFSYIIRARRLRTPYTSGYPLNFLGRYRRVLLNYEGRNWISEEPLLEGLRNALDPYEEDIFHITYTGLGMLTYNALETIIRASMAYRVIRKEENDGKPRYCYQTTELMQEYFGVPEEIGILA